MTEMTNEERMMQKLNTVATDVLQIRFALQKMMTEIAEIKKKVEGG